MHANGYNSRGRSFPIIMLLAGVVAGIVLYQQLSGPLRSLNATPRVVAPPAELGTEEKNRVEIFERIAPSVVFITSKKRGYYLFRSNVREQEQGSGSGFIWDMDGHIVTNHHVIKDGNIFEIVLWDQTSYDAKVVGVFADKDLAVLKIDAPRDKLKPIPVGTNENLKVGQSVLVIGNPFGFDHSLTIGVVSALDRTLESINQRKITGGIQTDAAINPGNSGGPLLDSAGRLIGVNTQIYSPSGASAGIGFAIPVDTVNEVIPLLIRDGVVKTPGLGVFPDGYSDIYARRHGFDGVLIRRVKPDSAAARAGLKGHRLYRDNSIAAIGDIIIAIDNKKISRNRDLSYVLSDYNVGDEVVVTFLRDGRDERKVRVQLEAVN